MTPSAAAAAAWRLNGLRGLVDYCLQVKHWVDCPECEGKACHRCNGATYISTARARELDAYVLPPKPGEEDKRGIQVGGYYWDLSGI